MGLVVPEQYAPGPLWGARGSLWSSGTHTGVDYQCPSGTPIYAVRAGRVLHAGPNSGSGWGPAYGNHVIVESGPHRILYAHASEVLVRVGDTVTEGQTIAKVGSTGNSTGPHVHLEVREAPYAYGNDDIDPMPFINATTQEADDMPEQRYLSKSRGETVRAGKEACIDWEKKSWGDGPGTSITLPGAATVQVTASIGLSARPDWMRVSVWEKQGETYVRVGGLGATQDVPDMGAAVYTIQSHGRVAQGRMLRLEIGAGDRDITVSGGSGLLSALVWS